MGKRHISLKDLANELGVSISTVSRALKNHPDISPEMTKKIKALAEERNYTPNPLAMGLLRQQTKMIGVIVPDINTHFYSSIISGIEKVAKEHGYFIVISSSNESMAKEIESVKNLQRSRVEGFIVCLSQETNDFSHFDQLIKNEIPLVFFDRVCEELDVSNVLANGQDATKKITQHFYENGCRRIAYISGPEHLNISQNRKVGYLNGLKECGLEYDENLLVHCNLSINDAKEATRKLLRLDGKPDAIFGVNDTIAFAAMLEVKKQGYKIPDDISLAGFTDEFHSIVVDPPLTSVSHPTFQMGEEAARLFFESLKEGKNLNKKVMLPIDLVVRQSSLRK
ncbi:LacI family DNA-binding transcriptional regulator [uncultured Draconibacterium sp.]|uniref:LacI family DNA-binding transcriptional regulator n=1 Tax=uncultured Draconibacterium sp. TaxID=1573823 RepID=UPI0025D1C750|nr:LacI family DNA-binding transcriptional regulator [uncultured Draconibacterium sp.]